MRVIGSIGKKWEEFVDKCYHVDTYNHVYAPVVMPMNGRELWQKSSRRPPIPPLIEAVVGRPQTVRRPQSDEPVQKGKKRHRGKPLAVKPNKKVKRFQRTVKCKTCSVEGHNSATCLLKKSVGDVNEESQQTQATEAKEAVVNEVLIHKPTQGEGSSRKKLPVKRMDKGKGKVVTRPVSAPFKAPSAVVPNKGPMSFHSMAQETANCARVHLSAIALLQMRIPGHFIKTPSKDQHHQNPHHIICSRAHY